MLYTRSRKVKNRVAIALRSGAQRLYHAQNYVGEFYRRMKRKLGGPEAVTATAHKLPASFITCSEPKRPITRRSS